MLNVTQVINTYTGAWPLQTERAAPKLPDSTRWQTAFGAPTGFSPLSTGCMFSTNLLKLPPQNLKTMLMPLPCPHCGFDISNEIDYSDQPLKI